MSDSEQCSWSQSQWPCAKDSTFLVEKLYNKTDGPTTLHHSLNTSYTITVAGITVPVVVTTREFDVSYSTVYGMPTSTWKAWKTLLGEFAVVECGFLGAENIYALQVTDECMIEKSTLHYLDQRYGVCLYRYQKDELHLDVSSSDVAGFKTTTGTFVAHQAQIKTSDYTASRTVEWRLIIGGVEQVLNHSVIELEPFGEKNNGVADTTGFAAGWVPDPEIRKILVFPQPPSQAIPLTPSIVRLGFYDYGNLPGEESMLNIEDGGYKDMFYPEWCRNLQADPIWREAADTRYNISWFHIPPPHDTNYTPPEIIVDPAPVGSHVWYPEIGNVYQWFMERIDGSKFLETTENLSVILDAMKVDATHDNTLYSPIGVA